MDWIFLSLSFSFFLSFSLSLSLSFSPSLSLYTLPLSSHLPYSCYISNIWVFFFAFLAPIFAILIFNFIIFLLVVRAIIRHHRNRYKDAEKGHIKETIKILVSLVGITFLFGTTWVFAVFTFISTNAHASFASQLLFAIFNTLQGFFVFFFFVVLNSDARQAWQGLICPCKKKKKVQPVISTSSKLSAKIDTGSSAGTLSSAVPSYQTSTLERNVQKYNKQSHELLSFSNPATVDEEEEESSSDLTEPPLESSPMEALSKVPIEEPEEAESTKKKNTGARTRIQRRSTRRRTHDIETVELDLGFSSEESLEDEDFER